MRALIVGWGSIGRRHAECLRAVAPNCGLIIWRQQAVDSSASREEASIADQVVFTADDALASMPDFAIISNPAPRHVETACILSDRAIPLLIEKPLAENAAAVAPLREQLRHRDTPVMIGYVLRFHPAVIAIRARLEAGDIGRILHARFHVGQHLLDWRTRRAGDWHKGISARRETGGGALLELSHELDLALYLLGGLPCGVTARFAATTLRDVDVEDNVDLLLDMPNGVVASVHLDMVSRPARRYIEIAGTAGTLSVDLIEGTASLWQDRASAWTTISTTLPDRNFIYKSQIEHFLTCLQRSVPPEIGIDDAEAVLKVIDAARHSAAIGQRVTP
jgi:predicted dehydrogenase